MGSNGFSPSAQIHVGHDIVETRESEVRKRTFLWTFTLRRQEEDEKLCFFCR